VSVFRCSQTLHGLGAVSRLAHFEETSIRGQSGPRDLGVTDEVDGVRKASTSIATEMAVDELCGMAIFDL